MNSDDSDSKILAEKIQLADAKLDMLERRINEIGQPAGQELRKRLAVLRVEETALKRNFAESQLRGEPDSVRMGKIETLLQYIEEEEVSVEYDADFLSQAAPSSMAIAVETSAIAVDLARKAVKKVLGDSHPFGESVFVNHSHEDLADEFGIENQEKNKDSTSTDSQ